MARGVDRLDAQWYHGYLILLATWFLVYLILLATNVSIILENNRRKKGLELQQPMS